MSYIPPLTITTICIILLSGRRALSNPCPKRLHPSLQTGRGPPGSSPTVGPALGGRSASSSPWGQSFPCTTGPSPSRCERSSPASPRASATRQRRSRCSGEHVCMNPLILLRELSLFTCPPETCALVLISPEGPEYRFCHMQHPWSRRGFSALLMDMWTELSRGWNLWPVACREFCVICGTGCNQPCIDAHREVGLSRKNTCPLLIDSHPNHILLDSR